MLGFKNIRNLSVLEQGDAMGVELLKDGRLGSVKETELLPAKESSLLADQRGFVA